MIIVDIRNVQNLQPFVNRLVNSGYKWSSNDVINLEDFKRKECIYVDTFKKELTYSSYSFAKDTGERIHLCKIITLNEYMKNFSKEDLKPGMVVEYKSGERRLVVEINGELSLISNGMFAELNTFNNDLTHDRNSYINIVAVYKTKPSSLATMLHTTDLIWKRPEEVTLTMQEIADKFGIPVEQLKIVKG
jgi:hypothetical protein